MFYKIISVFLCACMLTGSVSGAAYANPAVVAQTFETEETTEEVAETEVVKDTDEIVEETDTTEATQETSVEESA